MGRQRYTVEGRSTFGSSLAHDTLEAALADAAELAKRHNRDFYVVQRVAVARAAVTVETKVFDEEG